MEHLAAIAEALGVRPFEVLAAMDGDGPVLAVSAAEEIVLRRLDERIEAALDARLGPDPGSRRRDGAA
jgi:hypothetical protein